MVLDRDPYAPLPKPTDICPGGCSEDKPTCHQVMDSRTWLCQACGRAWNDLEVRARNRR